MNYPLFIVLLALSTYIPRALPAVVIDKIRFSQRWKVFLKLLPYTVMAALIFPSSLSADSQRKVGKKNIKLLPFLSLRTSCSFFSIHGINNARLLGGNRRTYFII